MVLVYEGILTEDIWRKLKLLVENSWKWAKIVKNRSQVLEKFWHITILDKNRRIQSFLNDIWENNSVIHISTTLVPSLDISIDDGQIYEIIERSLEMWLEERIDCTNF